MEADREYPSGIKWTKQRKAVYTVLEEATEPLSATEIYRRAEHLAGQGEYAMSTIYRILSAFEEHHLVEKSSFMGEETSVYELERGSHTHYAVCVRCHKRVALEGCPFMKMHLPKAQDQFEITGHKLELYGYCKSCREANGENTP